MAAKRAAKSASASTKTEAAPPAAEVAAPTASAPVPDEPAPAGQATDEQATDEAAEAPPEPANRAERRALAKGKTGSPPVGKVKTYGRGAPAGQTPRHWQGRRGG